MTDPNRMHVRDFKKQQQQPKANQRMGSSSGPNKTEARFAAWRLSLGYTLEFEPVKLRVGPVGSRCWYTPDYLETSGTLDAYGTHPVTFDYDQYELIFRPILYDVKARDPKTGSYRAEDDALVKIKAAAVMHPYFRFALAWPSVERYLAEPFEILEVG